MNWVIGAIPGLVGVFVIVLFTRGYRLMTTEPDLDLDDAEALYLIAESEERAKRSSLLDQASLRVARHLRALLPASAISWVQTQVDMAGREDGLDVDVVLSKVARWIVIVTPLIGVFILQGRFFLVLLSALVPLILPLAGLSGSAARRRTQIDRDLPDFLDVLAVTVSAGLGFRTALGIVSDRFGGPLAVEVRTALNQVANGATMRSAFTSMKERTKSESVDEFVTAYLQAEELGAPLVDTLNQIALDMRRANAQRLRQQAGRTEPRVSLLMTLVIVPGALVLLLGGLAVALDLVEVFSSISGG